MAHYMPVASTYSKTLAIRLKAAIDESLLYLTSCINEDFVISYM